MSRRNTESRLVRLWCPVCKEQAPHRVPAEGKPRCLNCEERDGVNVPQPALMTQAVMYPAR